MYFFDSHAHYFDRRFLTNEEGQTADELLPSVFAPQGTISHIVNVATNIENARLALAQVAEYKNMFAAVGIHPEDCQQIDRPEEQLAALRALLCCDADDPAAARRAEKVVALGEIGLDYYEHPGITLDKAKQLWYFERQLALAAEQQLPVIIHDREAHGDCFETILRYPTVRGVFHSFSGSGEMARELVKRGWYISFSGVVTFTNAQRVRKVAADVPPDRLLVETDAPYLAPHPHRGRRNDSSLICHTVETLASLHGLTTEQMAAVTAQNACRLFGLSTEPDL